MQWVLWGARDVIYFNFNRAFDILSHDIPIYKLMKYSLDMLLGEGQGNNCLREFILVKRRLMGDLIIVFKYKKDG